MGVPEAMRGKYDEISAIIAPPCDDRLGDEYRDLCLKALEKLCRRRPSPVLSRRPGTWAAGIAYAIGQANWLFDKDQPIHMTASELADSLGVSKSTASSAAAEIRKWLKIDHFNAEWALPSRMEDNPLLWLVDVDGLVLDARSLPPEVQAECARLGLIPYVPGRE